MHGGGVTYLSDARDVGLAIGFTSYLVLLALRQLTRKKPHWLRRVDYLNLFPSWRLFAPNPIVWDYDLIVVIVNANGFQREDYVTPYSPQRPLSVVWNPGRHIRKQFGLLVKASRQGSNAGRRANAVNLIVTHALAGARRKGIEPRTIVRVELRRGRLYGTTNQAEVVIKKALSYDSA